MSGKKKKNYHRIAAGVKIRGIHYWPEQREVKLPIDHNFSLWVCMCLCLFVYGAAELMHVELELTWILKAILLVIGFGSFNQKCSKNHSSILYAICQKKS